MLSLTAAERRALRARAHRLHPVVRVGQQGLTASVLHEIDVNLLAHELIKVRVFSADHVAREGLLARICAELEAAPVQHIGKLLVVWRPAPPPPAAPARTPKSSRGRKSPAAPATRRRERVRDAPPRVRTAGACRREIETTGAPPAGARAARTGANAEVFARTEKPCGACNAAA